jgi:hypothetical protein
MAQRILRALRELGPLSLYHYGVYSLGIRTGRYRRIQPVRSWEKVDLPDLPEDAYGAQLDPLFNLCAKDLNALLPFREAAEQRADAVLAGRFTLFGIADVDLGFPPDWQAFAPLTDGGPQTFTQPHQHWSLIDLADLPLDVKLIWEVSRFGWVFPLAQAYALSGDRRYVEGFMYLLRSWLEDNPPSAGLNWYSAQEVAIRLIALLFASMTFRDALSDDPEDRDLLIKALWAHGERIPLTLPYAKAQMNNHLLVECAALYLLAESFPSWDESPRWSRIGRRWFERGVNQQVFEDGGYTQHSTNYQRLALQAGILMEQATTLLGKPLQASTRDALGSMAECLGVLVDQEHGTVPNFGPNDGALLLHLSVSPFKDYRPTLQAAWRLFWGEARYLAGAHDDLAQWLVMSEPQRPIRSNPYASSRVFPQAGLHVMENESLRAILRAVEFQTRPGHSDQLHLEIWHQGFNLARDPGTYLYNADKPWDNSLAGAWCHNTVLVGGVEPMLRAGRFLWQMWSRAKILERSSSPEGGITVLCAQHTSDRWPGIRHLRTIALVSEDLIMVADDLLGDGKKTFRMNWNLPDVRWNLQDSKLTFGLSEGEGSLSWDLEDSKWGLYRVGRLIGGEEFIADPITYGWHAPTYALREPGLQLVIECEQTLPIRSVTYWAFKDKAEQAIEVAWTPVGAFRSAIDQLIYGDEVWNR